MHNQNQRSNNSYLQILQSGSDTGGELLEMIATYPANSEQPPSHYHPYQRERFQVLAGKFRTQIDGVSREFSSGEVFHVPVGVPHWMHNISDQEGQLNWQVRPAMKTQYFLETMWGLNADDKTTAGGVPNLLQLAVIMNEYRDEFRMTNPPYIIQRMLFSLLAPIGRLRGYQPRYPRYSPAD